MGLPHTDVLNIEDFCPSQFYFVMAFHAATIFIGVMMGFWMGYHATSKILAESWEMLPIFKCNFYIAYIAFNVVMVAWPLKIILCVSLSTYSGFIAQMIAILANMFVIITLVTTWIARIRIELAGSPHQISTLLYGLILSLYAFGVISVLIGQIGLTVSWTMESISLLDESASLILISAAVYLLLSFIFLIIFTKTLYRITLTRAISSRSNITSSSFDIVETEISDKIKKYLGLSFIGLTSAIISLLLKAFIIFFENFEFGIQLVSWVNSIDSLINFLVLFFQYGFAAEYYYYWCSCNDSLFQICMDAKVKNELKNRDTHNTSYIPTDNEDIDNISSDNDINIHSRPINHIGNESIELVPSSATDPSDQN